MVEYILKKNPRATRLSVRVDRDGQVIVTSPPFVTKAFIEKFLTEQSGWIHKKQAAISAKTPKNGGTYNLFGKPYRLEFTYDANLKTGWQIVDDRLIYNSTQYLLKPKNNTELSAKEEELLANFAKQTLMCYVSKRVPDLHAHMGISVPLGRICLKDQSSRWGSCSSQHNLNFNYHLVNFKPAVIDYVLIHELAHLVYMDHSAKFWALVAKFDGQYKLHRQLLNH